MLEKSCDDQIIDLDYIFHEEDPLRECVRETKNLSLMTEIILGQMKQLHKLNELKETSKYQVKSKWKKWSEKAIN